MIICVVGKSGSGKSFICKILESFSTDIIHLDIDLVAHNILNVPIVMNNLLNEFGDCIISNNAINRKELANIVFNSDIEMDKLTKITWPPMEMFIDKFIEENKTKIILLDWQNLLKTKYYKLSDLNILVKAPFENRIEKVLRRDNISKNDFDIREKASYDFDNAKFDYIIENDYSDKIKEKVREIYVKSIISR